MKSTAVNIASQWELHGIVRAVTLNLLDQEAYEECLTYLLGYYDGLRYCGRNLEAESIRNLREKLKEVVRK